MKKMEDKGILQTSLQFLSDNLGEGEGEWGQTEGLISTLMEHVRLMYKLSNIIR